MKIKIISRGVEAEAMLNIDLEEEKDAREVVSKGDVAYWPEGKCFCVFFGKTPASKDDKPVAASKVNMFGEIVSNIDVFKNITAGDDVKVDKA